MQPTLRDLQARAGRWARQAWPDRDVQGHLLKVGEEFGEAAKCFTKPGSGGDLGEELADIIIAAMVTADTAEEDIDVFERVIEKLSHNERHKVGTDYASWT